MGSDWALIGLTANPPPPSPSPQSSCAPDKHNPGGQDVIVLSPQLPAGHGVGTQLRLSPCALCQKQPDTALSSSSSSRDNQHRQRHAPGNACRHPTQPHLCLVLGCGTASTGALPARASSAFNSAICCRKAATSSPLLLRGRVPAEGRGRSLCARVTTAAARLRVRTGAPPAAASPKGVNCSCIASLIVHCSCHDIGSWRWCKGGWRHYRLMCELGMSRF